MSEHKAGPETDALIGVRVFGCTYWPGRVDAVIPLGVPHGEIPKPCHFWPVTTEIGAAWKVWLKMLVWVGHCEIIGDMEDYGRGPGDIVTVRMWTRDGDSEIAVTGLAPLAICQCALAVLGEPA